MDRNSRSARSYQINSAAVVVRYEVILRGADGKPMCILAEEAASAGSYNDGVVTYELSEAMCEMADELAAVHGSSGGASSSDEAESSEGEGENGQDCDDGRQARLGQRMASQEAVRTVMSTTLSGRVRLPTTGFTSIIAKCTAGTQGHARFQHSGGGELGRRGTMTPVESAVYAGIS